MQAPVLDRREKIAFNTAVTFSLRETYITSQLHASKSLHCASV